MSDATAVLLSGTPDRPSTRSLSNSSPSISRLPQSAAPKTRASVSGFARSMARIARRQRRADVGRRLADVAPVAAVRQREAVQLRKDAQVDVAVRLSGLGRLLVPDVADPLEEQQREDVALPVRPVDGAAAQDLRAVPEVGLQLLQRQRTRGHRGRGIVSPRRLETETGGCSSSHWRRSTHVAPRRHRQRQPAEPLLDRDLPGRRRGRRLADVRERAVVVGSTSRCQRRRSGVRGWRPQRRRTRPSASGPRRVPHRGRRTSGRRPGDEPVFGRCLVVALVARLVEGAPVLLVPDIGEALEKSMGSSTPRDC